MHIGCVTDITNLICVNRCRYNGSKKTQKNRKIKQAISARHTYACITQSYIRAYNQKIRRKNM